MGLTEKDLVQLKEELRQLPAPDRSNRQLTLNEVIRQLVSEIELLRERGYGYDEISTLLQQRGVTAPARSLKQYYYAERTALRREKQHDLNSTDNSSQKHAKRTNRRKKRSSKTLTDRRKADSQPPAPSHVDEEHIGNTPTNEDRNTQLATTSVKTPSPVDEGVAPRRGTFTPRPDRSEL